MAQTAGNWQPVQMLAQSLGRLLRRRSLWCDCIELLITILGALAATIVPVLPVALLLAVAMVVVAFSRLLLLIFAPL